MKGMKYVVIGNSAGAIGCIEGIRQVDQEGSITLISKEPYHTYSRPLISYYLLGKTDEERMKYRPGDFYEKHNVQCRLGISAERIDPMKKEVFLEDGSSVGYDRLLVATGSNPMVVPIKGLETVEKKFTFMTLDDAKALEGELDRTKRVLIIGAGLIGLKCAEGICRRVKTIDVVDLADRILPSILDEAGAEIVQRQIEEQGVTFHLSDSIERFERNTAWLQSGQEIEFDLLVMAVGVRPNIALLQNAGAETERGVLVDEHLRTSLPDVYAAGDCTQGYDVTTGEKRVLALLPNAYMQGECAGKNMAGEGAEYRKGIPMNAIGFFGLHMITAGSYEGEDYLKTDGKRYKRLISKDGMLKGYILIGDIARAGIYTALIREQKPLESIDYELICEKPQLMAFSKADRAEQLGGKPQ